jgi:hypothetical protein
VIAEQLQETKNFDDEIKVLELDAKDIDIEKF